MEHEMTTTMKVVLVIASHGYQAIEYSDTKQELEKAGISVITASEKAGTAIAHNNYTKTNIDKTIDEITNPNIYAGIFLIGGPGAMEHLNIKKVHSIIKAFAEQDKPFGAICISPRILAQTGLLKHKHATGWESKDNPVDPIFAKYGVKYVKQNIAVDGKIITANGPKSARAFGKAIASLIKQ